MCDTGFCDDAEARRDDHDLDDLEDDPDYWRDQQTLIDMEWEDRA